MADRLKANPRPRRRGGPARMSWHVTVVLVTLGAIAAAAAAAPPAHLATPRYTVQTFSHTAANRAPVSGLVYAPTETLTQPPAVVVLLPGLFQSAASSGVRRYAHVFASNGLAVVSVSGPFASDAAPAADGAAAATSSKAGARQPAAAPRARPSAVASDAAGTSPGRHAAAVSDFLQHLGRRGAVDASAAIYWGAEWGGAAAVEAAAGAAEGKVKAVLLQVGGFVVCRAARGFRCRCFDAQRASALLSVCSRFVLINHDIQYFSNLIQSAIRPRCRRPGLKQPPHTLGAA
jgi:hypothetical protein